MNDALIQAYIWQEVIHRAFHPPSVKDRKIWLRLFTQSLVGFWGVETIPAVFREEDGKLTGSINASSIIDLNLDYSIESLGKYGVRILYASCPSGTPLMWIHDVDDGYLKFPSQALLSHCEMRERAMNEFSRDHKDHMEKVVDGLLIHPTVHQHLESPIDNHDIRVGGGIDNPFQYLFQLRYQLCPLTDNRESEKNRLVELFSQAIKEDISISAKSLMDV